jgi:hypothetical protein
VLQQVLQQHEFLRRQLDLAAFVQHRVAAEIHDQRTKRQRRSGRLRALRATHQRANPRHQFVGAERLRDVVVGADLETDDAVALLGARGQHDDRNRGGRLVGAQRPAHLETAEAGQHHIEDDQVSRAAACARQRLVASLGDVRAPAGA